MTQINRKFSERLRDFLKQSEERVGITAVETIEVPGLIAFVIYSTGDIDIYFDPDNVVLVQAERWGTLPYPAELEPFNLGRLLAQEQIPNARSVEEAVPFLHKHLRQPDGRLLNLNGLSTKKIEVAAA